MKDVFVTWSGWAVTELPADGAEVYFFDGAPPAGALSIVGDAGCLDVLFCRRGSLTLELFQGETLCLSAGRVLFLPGRMGGGCCRFYGERFQGLLVREAEGAALAALRGLWPGAERALPDRGHGCGAIETALWSEAMFSALERLPEARRGNYCAIKLLELLYLLHGREHPPHTFDREERWNSFQLQAVKAAHDYMLEHMEQRLTIGELAHRFHISGTLLKEGFRHCYGAPIHHYLLERRMARAAQLLTSTDQTVLQIAGAVGYSSTSQFSAAFKSCYGVSPSAFRRMSKNV